MTVEEVGPARGSSRTAPASHTRTLVAMAVGALAISFAAIFFRLAPGVDPLLASAIRLGIAALVLAPVVVRAWRSGGISRAARHAAVWAGLFYAVHFGTWVASLSRTTVAASVTLVTATPLLSALVAFAEGKDRPTRRHGIAIVLALGGVALIAGSDVAGGRWDGDLLALAGAAAMVAYLRLVRGLGDELGDTVAFSGLAAGWGALFLLPALALAAVLGGDDATSALAMPSTGALGWIALSALVPQVVGHTLLTYALRRATPTEVGLATAAEPVLSTLLAWFWLAEVPTSLVFCGCAVTLVGVVLGARPGAPRDGVEKLRKSGA